MRLRLFPYIFFACALAWVICSSWHPNIESYLVAGKVLATHGEAAATTIKYTQDKNNHDYEEMASLDVLGDGNFQAVINVQANGPVYFYAHKTGYTTARKIATLKNKGSLNDLGEIRISSLFKGPDLGQLNGTRPFPVLALYKDECLRSLDDEVSVDKIRFFEDLRVLSASNPGCLHGQEFALLKASVNLAGQRSTQDAYFRLFKTGNGEAYIAASGALSNPPSTARGPLGSRE